MNAVREPSPTGEVILGLPAAAYQQRELGVATSGQLQQLRTKTPAHHLAWTRAEDSSTPATAFGRAYHCRVLEPLVFATWYVSPPTDAPKDLRCHRNAKTKSQATLDSIAWWDSYDERMRGKFVLDPADGARLEAMVAALKAHPLANALLFEYDGDAEVTMRWVDAATGVRCKARPDRVVRRPDRSRYRSMVDLKSSDDASPVGFSKAVHKYGYHIQQAHYTEGAKACGIELDEYLIVVQEKTYPYLVAVYQLDAATETLGYEQRQQGVQTMADCIAANEWPGYAPGVQELSLPAYAFGEAMEISYVD